MTTMEPPQQPSGTTLYERLGGRPGLALLLRRFYADVRRLAAMHDKAARRAVLNTTGD